MKEKAFHKLKRTSDFSAVKLNGLKPSVPASEHWLGEGIYFFLNPGGFYWAKRWPCKMHNPRTDSSDGIISTEINVEHALDLRNDLIRNKTHNIVNKIKLKLALECREILKNDGAIFAAIFRMGALKELVNFQPTAIIANFDKSYEKYRIPNSAVFLTVEEMMITRTAQIQACVINAAVIGELNHDSGK